MQSVHAQTEGLEKDATQRQSVCQSLDEPVSGKLLTAIEISLSAATDPAEFAYAKIVHVMEGAVEIMTARGSHHLPAGTALALGSGHWIKISPKPSVRLWAVYADEHFLRTQMAWFLPDKNRLLAGLHPHEWDSSALVLEPGLSTLRQVEPIWRRLSLLHHDSHEPELVALRTVELFAQWIGIVLPTFLGPDTRAASGATGKAPITGRLTAADRIGGHVERAAQVLHERMNEPWTTTTLARSVAVSRTHLTRLFTARKGLPPMQYLREVRLTEFTRLIEETDMSVANAARAVGWTDPRIASTWFSRRFGVTPSQFRSNPHQRVSPERSRRAPPAM